LSDDEAFLSNKFMTQVIILGWSKQKRLTLITVLAMATVLYWYLKQHVSIDQLVAEEQRVRDAIQQYPWRSFAIGLAIYATVSLVPGTSGKSIIFAWLFGFWQGVLLILLGLTTAGMTMFFLSRYVFRDWIEQRYGRFLAALNRHLKQEGAFYLLVLRMAHFPFSIINLASGASRVQPGTFCWTTSLGLLPGTVVFAYVGVRLPSLDQLAANGASSLIDPPLILALILSAVFPFVFRAITRRMGLLRDTGSGNDSSIHVSRNRSDP
jgi:uncharacterized membrane protein YdjX (TVP38/TMEM64 family)